MSEQHIILRRTTLNGVIIEDARFISTAPSRKQAEEIASLFEDDTKPAFKSLIGFSLHFYVRTYEQLKIKGNSMISPHHIINARKKKLEDFEASIDKSLENHFKVTSSSCSIALNNIDITKDEIIELVMKYHNGGWVVSHEEGCDDRPCGSCWNYLKFSLPDKTTTFG